MVVSDIKSGTNKQPNRAELIYQNMPILHSNSMHFANSSASTGTGGTSTAASTHTGHSNNQSTNEKPANLKSDGLGNYINIPSLKHSASSVSAFMNRFNSNYISHSDEIPIDFNLEELPMTIGDLRCDHELNLLDNEPESWSQSVPKEILRSFKDKKAIKRQEQIFEFILNEKRNYVILLLMQNMFSEGLERYFHFDQSVLDRLFPRLSDLISLHADFLKKLRRRQCENYFVESIADILVQDFFEFNCNRLKSIYGEFCTQHNEAVDLYKTYSKPNSDFRKFENFCKNSPLLKKRGIHECILHVSLILTKYPLLIQPMIDTCQDLSELTLLKKSLKLSQEIVTHVDNAMAKKQREDRKLEIYEKVEEKSSAMYRGKKFKRSDLLNANRSLLFEGTATLLLHSNRTKFVTVVVLTDVLIFFHESSSQKFVFFKPSDSCSAVISLQKILIRKKASCKDRDPPNTIFLVVSSPNEPTMIELHVETPKEIDNWDNSIRFAVINCPIDDDFLPISEQDKAFILKQNEIRNLVESLRQKDVEQAIIMEEKMSLQLRLLATSGIEPPVLTSYRHLVSESCDNATLSEIVLSTVQELSHLASSMYTCSTHLSRSLSSAGEHQSGAYTSTTLPKRAGTFGGFDNDTLSRSSSAISLTTTGSVAASTTTLNPTTANAIKLLTKKFQSGFSNFADNVTEIFDNNFKMMELNYKNGDENDNFDGRSVNCADRTSPTLTVAAATSTSTSTLEASDKEHQKVVVQLSHYAYTLLCIVTQLMTNNESLKAELQLLKSSSTAPNQTNETTKTAPHYRHNQQLEELRSLQDKFTADKIKWQKQCEQKESEFATREREFALEKEQSLEKIRRREQDLEQQREQLFRQLERLKNHGVLLSPCNSSTSASTVVSGTNTSSVLIEDKRNKANLSQISIGGGGSCNISGSNVASVNFSMSNSMSSPISTTSSSPSTSTSNAFSTSQSSSTSSSTLKKQLPINLLSVTNQQKALAKNLPVKQQLPYKLAKKGL